MSRQIPTGMPRNHSTYQLVEIHKVTSLPGKDLLTANLADDKSILHFHVAAFLRSVILKKNNLVIFDCLFGPDVFSHQSCATGTLLLPKSILIKSDTKFSSTYFFMFT